MSLKKIDGLLYIAQTAAFKLRAEQMRGVSAVHRSEFDMLVANIDGLQEAREYLRKPWWSRLWSHP